MLAIDVSNRTHAALIVTAVAVWLGSGLACVDTKRSQAPGGQRGVGGQGGVRPVTCEVSPPVPYSGAAVIPSEDTAAPGPYVWKNVAIKGGGFVSGIVMSPALQGLAFARTDVGGAYRFDPAARRWMPITDWVGHDDSNSMGIESIAADPVDPNRVYIAAGTYLPAGNGWILSSTDMGQTWARNAIAAPMGGNVDGRSMGERLAIDPNLPSTLYFGSRNTGLWMSTDSAQTWTAVSNFPTTGATNGGVGSSNPAGIVGTGYGLTFVVFDPRSGSPGSATPAIYVGVGVGVTDGTGLYRSMDAGQTWEAVAGQPAGMMPHHAVLDGCGNLYLAYNNGSGPNGITAGAVWRYTMAAPPDSGATTDGGTIPSAWTDVSPPHLVGGFGGISADPGHPGTLIVTTMDFWSPGEIFRTTNGGVSWAPIYAAAQHDVAGATWLWWHGTSLPAAGWMGDVELDPFNAGRALYITGQGLWSSDDVTSADTRAPTHWTFGDDGLEETVVLDLASPPAMPEGSAQTSALLLSGVGDIAGFRHDDLDVSPPNGMFSNPIFGNTTSIDFAEGTPNIVARVGTSSSSNGKRGAYSTDGGTTWTPFASAPAVTGAAGTTPPAPTSGSIAVSADGTTFVWAPQRPATGNTVTPSYSQNKGVTWIASVGLVANARVAADRVNPSKFYATNGGRMYVSTDGGATFAMVSMPPNGRPRPVFGIEGDVWVATGSGLQHSQDSAATFVPVPQVTSATAVGFGMAATGQSYPAVYVAGSVSGVWGTYRSDDAGATWQRIDDPQHQFGFVNILAGDRRQYGRVYLGTGGRGILYGHPR